MSPDAGATVFLLGDPVAQSLSASFQDAAFAALRIDCRYRARQVTASQLATVMDEIRNDYRVLGANVTIPHKQAVVPLLDALDPVSSHIKAVNTISREGASLRGRNTDVEGFRRALADAGYDANGKTVAIVGAGGAARAVASVLQPVASGVWVLARRAEQARLLCEDLGIERGGPAGLDRLGALISRLDLVVNAAPVDLPAPAGGLPVFDLRYRHSPQGLAMLLYQGAAAFEIWTGQPAPLDVMRAALQRAAEGAAA